MFAGLGILELPSFDTQQENSNMLIHKVYIYIHEFIGVRSNFIDNGGQSYSWQKSSFNLGVFVPYQSVAIVI